MELSGSRARGIVCCCPVHCVFVCSMVFFLFSFFSFFPFFLWLLFAFWFSARSKRCTACIYVLNCVVYGCAVQRVCCYLCNECLQHGTMYYVRMSFLIMILSSLVGDFD